MASGSTSRKSERMGSLDLLRLVAALAVLFFHYFFHGSYLPPLLVHGYPEAGSLAIYGYMGVNLFSDQRFRHRLVGRRPELDGIRRGKIRAALSWLPCLHDGQLRRADVGGQSDPSI